MTKLLIISEGRYFTFSSKPLGTTTYIFEDSYMYDAYKDINKFLKVMKDMNGILSFHNIEVIYD